MGSSDRKQSLRSEPETPEDTWGRKQSLISEPEKLAESSDRKQSLISEPKTSAEKDETTDNKDDNSSEKELNNSDNELTKEDISESEEKESAQDKAPDSFINDIYESEGRQSLPEEDIEVSVPEAKSENTAPDSFINDIYKSEGRQASPDKDLEESESKSITNDKAPDSFINDIYTSEGKQAVPEKIEMKENISSTEKVLEVIISESEKSEENVKSSDELEEHQNDEKTTSLEKESDNDEGMEKPSNDTVSISVDMKTKEKSQETNLLDNLSSPKDEAKFAPGVLELTGERASQLVNNDKIGKSDPYVKITYRDEEFRSKTVKNTLDPEWNFSCEIDIPDQEEKYIHINVYDDDFGKDNIEGCFSLSVTEAISDIPKDGKWYSLVGCKTGKVY